MGTLSGCTSRRLAGAPIALALVAFLAASAGGPGSTAMEQAKQPETLAGVFEARYKAWVSERHRVSPLWSSEWTEEDHRAFYGTDSYRALVALGARVLPEVWGRLESDGRLARLVWDITKWRYETVRSGAKPGQHVWTVDAFPDMKSTTGPPGWRSVLLRWWRENPKWTEERFARLYQEWKALTAEGKREEAEARYQAIKDLGIAALPYMMEKVKAGETALMPAIAYLTDGAVPADSDSEACLAWWEENRERWTIPFEVPLPEPAEAEPAPTHRAPRGQAPPTQEEVRALVREAKERARRAAEEAGDRAAERQAAEEQVDAAEADPESAPDAPAGE
jgi:hypothetical protein